MTGDARDNRGEQSEDRRAEDARLSDRLRGLGDELGRHRPREPAGEQRGQAASGAGYALGFRLSSELVAGVLAGAGIGWALDLVSGIKPWGMIVFTLLGFVAGVVNVIRAAGAGRGTGPDRPPDR
jgi:ATP synthase protein I